MTEQEQADTRALLDEVERLRAALIAALAQLESANSEEAEWGGDTLEMTRAAMLGMRAALGQQGEEHA